MLGKPNTAAICSAWLKAVTEAYGKAGAGLTMTSNELFETDRGVLAVASPLLGVDAAMASSMIISCGQLSDEQVSRMHGDFSVSKNAGRNGWPAIKANEPVAAYIKRVLDEKAAQQPAAGAGAGAGS
jgi:hypothetical protein